MAQLKSSWLGQLAHKRAVARWAAAAEMAEQEKLDVLRGQRQQAKQLRAHLDEIVHVADSRLALPRIGSNAFPRPSNALWTWRPQAWRGALARRGEAGVASKTRLGDELTLFHDCRASELSLRQVRNLREEDLAPFAMRLDVFEFSGSFLSLVLDFPKAALDGMLKRHLVQVRAIVEMERPIEIFARLNVRHGPNTEQVVHELPKGAKEALIEFDLAYTDLNEKRIEGVWLDLIFEGPQMNQITIRDLTVCRYPRAEL